LRTAEHPTAFILKRPSGSYIDAALPFNMLEEKHKDILFSGLDGILDQAYYNKIWEILTLRWEHVKGFRIA